MKTSRQITSVLPLAAVAMAGLLLTTNPAHAQSTPAVSVSPGTVGLTNWVVGWTFSTSTTIRVTDLGKFDANGGGLAADVQVGLYSVATNSLITSVTVPMASPAELNGSYDAHYAAITPVELAPGEYFVAATDQGNESYVRNSGKTTAPEITWITGRAVGGTNSTLQVAVTDYGTTGNGYFGATFKYDTNVSLTTEPKITSITSVGGGVWELTLKGEANTAFEFRSSATLDFTPGTLVESLTQGNPGTDPGAISGTNSEILTTDGNGDATVRMTLTGNPADFVRAQSVP